MPEQSKRILKAIYYSGLTYTELEKKTGIAKSSIQRYATGHTKKIPVDAIKLIADATDTSAAWIMGWEEEPTKAYDQHPIISQEKPPENLSVREFNEFSIFIGKMGYYITLDEEGYTIADNNSNKRKRISIEELKTLVRTSNNVVKSLIDSLMSEND